MLFEMSYKNRTKFYFKKQNNNKTIQIATNKTYSIQAGDKIQVTASIKTKHEVE